MKNRFNKFIVTALTVMMVLGQGVLLRAEESVNDVSEVSVQNYYVDATNGSDDNDGLSAESAWQTLDKVNEKEFVAGDQILLKRGESWTGSLNLKGSGEPNNRIILSAYGEGERPAIHGNGVEDVIQIKNEQHWEIANLEITNDTGTAATSPRKGVHVINENYGGEGLTETNLDSVTVLKDFYIHDLYIHDINGQDQKDAKGSAGIQFTVSIPNMINDQIPTDDSINQRTTFDGIKIEDNILEDIHRSGIIIWSDWKSRDLLRFSDHAYGDKEKTPWTPVLNVHIKGNKLYNIGGDGIAPHMTDGAIVEYNYIDGYNTRSTGYNAGMWLWNGDHALFQFNEATGGKSTRDGMPWDFDQGTQGTIYQYNYSYDNEGGTLLFCSENAGEGVKDGIYRYNLAYNDRYQTFTICGGNNLKDVDVYNNVFYIGEGVQTAPSVAQGGSVQANIFNNIFVNNGPKSYTGKPSFNYSHNLYAGINQNGLASVDDSFKVLGDPSFVNAEFPGTVLNKDMATRDIYDWSALSGFMIQEDSDALNAGRFIAIDQTVHPGAHDLFKNNLYNGLPDIGIHESWATAYDPVDPFIPEKPRPIVEIKNGGFEDVSQHGNLAPWNYQWNGGITSDNPYEGTYSGVLKATGSGASIEQTFAVNENTSYEISAYTLNGVEGEDLYLGVNFGQGDMQVAVTHTEYGQSTIEFDIPEGVTNARVFFYRVNGSTSPSYIDNVVIKAKSTVDTEALEIKLEEANNVDVTTLTLNSKTLLEETIASTMLMLEDENVDQERINEMLAELEGVLENLVLRGDVSPLENEVERFNNLDKTLYTENSIAALETIVDEAKNLVLDENVTEEMVSEMLGKLETAFESLEKVEESVDPGPVNKSSLVQYIEFLEAIDKTLYTEESVEQLTAAIEVARLIVEDESATQQAVDDALLNLQVSYDALEQAEVIVDPEIVDKTQLIQYIAFLETLDRSLYTEVSLKQLDTAIEVAKLVVLDDSVTQADVNATLVALQEAYKSLEENDTPIEKPKEEKEDETNETPKTGIGQYSMFYISLVLISLLAIVSLSRKRYMKQ